MRTGLSLFATDRGVRPDDAARWAEERGFDAIYLPEHTHIPVERLTPHPLTGADLDDRYRRTLDPWVALATAAVSTARIRLGTAVALVAEHDPIALAKQVATLDHLSGGRVVLGVGYGWNHDELLDHGVDPGRRRDVVREHVLAMEALWADDPVGFDGEFVRLRPSWAWPKPVQRPRVPVLVGGAAGPRLFGHVAEFGDGWMPHGGSGLGRALPRLHEAWERAGRPGAPRVVPVGVLPDAGRLEHYARLGVDEVAFEFPDGGSGDPRPELDRLATLAERFG